MLLAGAFDAGGKADAADWVNLLARDPFKWVDLDSVRTDSSGFIRIQLSLSGNPARRSNTDVAMRILVKAVDCKNDNTVYDVGADGNVIRGTVPTTSYEKILAPVKDEELDKALFSRVCLNKRLGS